MICYNHLRERERARGDIYVNKNIYIFLLFNFYLKNKKKSYVTHVYE